MDKILSAFNAPKIDWSDIKSQSSGLDILILGLRPYQEVRQIQNELVEKRKKNLIRDTIIFTEHPPTLTLGKRLNLKDLDLSEWQKSKVEIYQTDRGGELTLHAPGQLVLYPVINLRERKLGVSDFIREFFALITLALKKHNIDACCKLNPAGLWVNESKIASVGLRIDRGVTNHGFSLNLSCSLEPFLAFEVCGQKDAKITSVLELSNDANILNSLIKILVALFLKF